MGANDREQDRKLDKRARSKEQRGRRASAGRVDWSNFDWVRVVALTRTLVASGGALRIGATRDGGAWALGVYLGDDYATEYIRPAEDFGTAIEEIATAWMGSTDAYLIELEHLMTEAKR